MTIHEYQAAVSHAAKRAREQFEEQASCAVERSVRRYEELGFWQCAAFERAVLRVIFAGGR
jgi:predicted ATPase